MALGQAVDPKKMGQEPATHAVVLSTAAAFQPLEIPGFASGVKLDGDPAPRHAPFKIELTKKM